MKAIGINKLQEKLSPKCIGVGTCTKGASFKPEKSRCPIKPARVYPAIKAIKIAELFTHVIRMRFSKIIKPKTVHDMIRLSALAKVLFDMA